MVDSTYEKGLTFSMPIKEMETEMQDIQNDSQTTTFWICSTMASLGKQIGILTERCRNTADEAAVMNLESRLEAALFSTLQSSPSLHHDLLKLTQDVGQLRDQLG